MNNPVDGSLQGLYTNARNQVRTKLTCTAQEAAQLLQLFLDSAEGRLIQILKRRTRYPVMSNVVKATMTTLVFHRREPKVNIAPSPPRRGLLFACERSQTKKRQATVHGLPRLATR